VQRFSLSFIGKPGYHTVLFDFLFVLFVAEFTLATVCHGFHIISSDGYCVQVITLAKQTIFVNKVKLGPPEIGLKKKFVQVI
jgi:hypothetical protein